MTRSSSSATAWPAPGSPRTCAPRTAATVTITVLGAEPHEPYNRILLPTCSPARYGGRRLTLPDVAGERPARGAPGRAGRRDRPRGPGRASPPTARRHRYDQLVLATGSRAVVPPLAGLLDRGALPTGASVVPHPRRLPARSSPPTPAPGAPSCSAAACSASRRPAGWPPRGCGSPCVHPAADLMERQLDPAPARCSRRDPGRARRRPPHRGRRRGGPSPRTGPARSCGSADGAAARRPTCSSSPAASARDTDLAAAAGLRRASAASWSTTGCARDDRGDLRDRRLRRSTTARSTGLVAPAWEQARVAADVITGDEPLARYRAGAGW